MSTPMSTEPNHPIQSSSLRPVEGSSEFSETSKPLQPASTSEKPTSFMDDMMAAFSSLLQSFADSQMENFAEYLGRLAAGVEDLNVPIQRHSPGRYTVAPEGHRGDKNQKGLGNGPHKPDERANSPSNEAEEASEEGNEAPKETYVGTIVNSYDSYTNSATTINIYQFK